MSARQWAFRSYTMALLLANSAVDLSYWGYIEAVRELDQQIQLSGDVQFDDIVVACGRRSTGAWDGNSDERKETVRIRCMGRPTGSAVARVDSAPPRS